MSNYRRRFVAGVTYFFTVVTEDRATYARTTKPGKPMYRKIMLGLLTLLLAIIGYQLTHPRTIAAPMPEPPGLNSSLALLDRKIPELILHHVTMEQAVRALRGKTDVPIEVDWDALKEWRNLPVDVEFRDTTLGDVAAFLFSPRDRSFPTANYADFDIFKGKLIITSVFRLPTSCLNERTYDVRDLLTDEYWGCLPGVETREVQDQRFRSLWNLLENISGVQNWYDIAHGGGSAISGSERYGLAEHETYAGRLSILQTAYNQRLVASILGRLRTGDSGLVSQRPMSRRIGKLNFVATPLRDVIQAIGLQAKVSIAFETKVHDSPTLDLKTPVTISLENVTVEAALSAIKQLASFNFDDCPGGVIVINTESYEYFGIDIVDLSPLAKAIGRPFNAGTADIFYDYRPGFSGNTEEGTELQTAIYNGSAPHFFGTRLVLTGSERSRSRALQICECLKHPVDISANQSPPVDGAPSRTIPQFQLTNVDATKAFTVWRTLAGPNVVMNGNPAIQDFGEPISVDLSNVPLEDALDSILQSPPLQNEFHAYSIEDGIIFLDGKGIGVPRAYDIAPLLKSSDWYHPDGDVDATPVNKRKELELIRRLPGTADTVDPVCWHGRLLVTTTPGKHRRIFDFLRHVQTTGQLPEEPKQ